MTDATLVREPQEATFSDVIEIEDVMAEASRRTGLDDFGSEWFRTPLAKLIDSVNAEAGLGEQGRTGFREQLVRNLINRLRMFEEIRQHPEILDQEVDVACVIVGLPRTGSTMFHRMLAANAEMTAVKWWELQNYAPFPGEERGNPVERRAAAEGIMRDWLLATPQLASMHPLSIDQPDEEVVLLQSVFTGTATEAFVWVPSFVAWLKGWDQKEGYADLVLMLKFLQWQSPDRAGKRWILKAPSHLSAPEAVFDTFPNALIVTTHREPRQVIGSICSFTYTLYQLFGATPDPIAIGSFFSKRWADAFEHFDEVRRTYPQDRFMDINYLDVLKDPIGQASKVYARLGLTVTPEAEEAMRAWLEENARSERPAHDYDPAMFGVTDAQLDDLFADYRRTYFPT